MRFLLTGLTALALAFSAWAQSVPADGPTTDSLRKTFDACDNAIKSKNFPGLLAQMTAATRKQFVTGIPPSQRTPFFLNAMLMVPDSYEVESVRESSDGTSASLVVVAMLPPMPSEMRDQKDPGGPRKREMTVAFAKEAGLWKIASRDVGDDPDKRPRPKDLKMGQRGDYSAGANTDMGGMILRTEKQDAGTVYVIRIVDEEDAVFVPAQLVSADFVIGKVASFHAAQNANDPLKYWAESAKLEK
jgi:hypothetical protein